MLGAQYGSTTLTNFLMISFLAANACNMDQISKLIVILIYKYCKLFFKINFNIERKGSSLTINIKWIGCMH
jgi:hypothetical protein